MNARPTGIKVALAGLAQTLNSLEVEFASD